jgi:ARG/rhodanese/phosphatase superfamily protein
MDTNRRRFLGWGMGALGAMGVPGWAWGQQRLRVLDGDPSDGMPPLIATQVSHDFQRWMRAMRVGQSASHGALQIFWLHATEPSPPLDVTTLDEARLAGSLLITERAQASVPELVVENRGKSFVLLLAGEILVGGKQNRVLREDILLPPLSGPRPIGVYCVEQGRWNEGRKDFESKGSVAQPRLRQQLLGQAHQTRIWDTVAKATREANPSAPPSPTGSYQAIYDDREVQKHLKDVEQALSKAVAGTARAHGAAVFAGGALSGLDIFHDPGLFAREWLKLLRAHAVEAYRKPVPREPQDGKLRAQVEALLAQAAKVEGSLRGNAGAGQLFEFRVEGSRGAALVAEGRVVHTAIL